MPDRPFPSQMENSPPHVLVADDDATSRRFFGEALHQLGARVVLSPGGADALENARTIWFDLLILDRRMPDIDAEGVLRTLRNDSEAASACTPAVATSAELDAVTQRRLLSDGFHAVLLKPCTLRDLQKTLTLAQINVRLLPVLNDDAALSTSGRPEVVRALRKLFREELLNVYEELDALCDDRSALEARLHKLRSSCGFCGATSLAERTALLQKHVKLAHRGMMLPLRDFRQSLRDTIQALDAL